MPRHLGPLDAAWLHLDSPENPMVITAVMLFAAPLPWDAVRQRITDRMLGQWSAFRRRIPDVRARRPHWEDDPGFDLDAHLLRTTLPSGTTLEALTAELGSAPLDVSSPPWRMTVVDGVGAGSAVIARFHHCLADGMALARVLLSITDEGDGGPGPPRPAAAHGPHEPALDPPSLIAALELSAEAAVALEHLLVMPADPSTPLRRPLSGQKVCGWTGPLSLDRVKAVGKRHGATVNDVLLASLAGALRPELGPEFAGPGIRSVIPVDRRSGAPVPEDLGNQFTMVWVPLPVIEPQPLDRLRIVAEETHRLRTSVAPVVTEQLLRWVGHSPLAFQRLATEIMGRKASVVVTNVPGPRERRHLAGVPLDHLLVWVPQAGPIGVGVSLVSYAGEVRIGVAADRECVADPGALAARVADEITRLDRA